MQMARIQSLGMTYLDSVALNLNYLRRERKTNDKLISFSARDANLDGNCLSKSHEKTSLFDVCNQGENTQFDMCHLDANFLT